MVERAGTPPQDGDNCLDARVETKIFSSLRLTTRVDYELLLYGCIRLTPLSFLWWPRSMLLLSTEFAANTTSTNTGGLPDIHLRGIHLQHAIEAHDLLDGLFQIFLRGRSTT
jgi:hypothetical protein